MHSTHRLLQVNPNRMKDITFFSGVHKERRKTIRPAPQRKRHYINNMDTPVVIEPNVPHALWKLWNVFQLHGVFSLYDKEVYRHESDTDTAWETEEEAPLQVVLSRTHWPQYEHLIMLEQRNLGREVYEHVKMPDVERSFSKLEQLTREQVHTPTREISGLGGSLRAEFTLY